MTAGLIQIRFWLSYRWVFSVVTDGSQGFLVGTDGSQGFSVVTDSYQGFSVVTDSYQGFSVVADSYQRFSVVTDSYQGFPVVTDVSQGFCYVEARIANCSLHMAQDRQMDRTEQWDLYWMVCLEANHAKNHNLWMLRPPNTSPNALSGPLSPGVEGDHAVVIRNKVCVGGGWDFASNP